MATRNMTVTKISYWKYRKKDQPLDVGVGALPDGSDLFDHIRFVMDDLKANPQKNTVKETYSVLDRRRVQGRTLLAVISHGTYGETARVIDTANGQVQHTQSAGEASAPPLRVAAFVPEHGSAAMLFIEHSQRRNAGHVVLERLRLRWMDHYKDHTLHTEALVEQDAWLEYAQLEGVEALVYGHETDIADHGVPKVLGTLRHVIEPAKGERVLPSWVWKRLKQKDVNRADVLGMEEEPDDVVVTLGNGERSRKFSLSTGERTPKISYSLTTAGQPPLTDEQFLKVCSDIVTDLMHPVGVNWQTGWEQGKVDLFQ